jgi:molybdopterin converting factor small subunit
VPGLRNRIVDAGPVLREHLNVFVAGQRADLSTTVRAGETVHIIPAVSGGAA